MKKLLMRLAPLALGALLIVPLGCDRDGEETTMMTPDDTPMGLGILEAARTGVAPTIDGVISAGEWDGANAIYVPVTVPDIDEFPGYEGRGYQVKMRAKFDNNNIYFLAEWDDPGLNLDRQTWYFDTASSSWKQESARPVFDENGNQTREAFYEDKFSLMFEASPVAGFATQGCWVACHTGLAPTSNDGGKVDLKYTRNGGEIMDMWHWKSVRNTSQDTFDDQYTDSQRSARNGGRHSDVGVNSYVNNSATVDGFSVPKYVIPDASSRYYWVVTDGSGA
ncbi:MAG: hypothetical protein HKN21_09680, partial [Candidatus Eisenbacteria bacterium]|nr:hypothetical protein [Candidatus Eisenbacteria bacterium]